MKSYFAIHLPVKGEIKKGDKFIHTLTNQIHVNEDITPINHPDYKRVKLYLCSRNIGIIGEIDFSNATWIQEGEEFDRNDFEMRWVNSKGESSLTMSDVDTEEEPPVLKVFIKNK